MPNGATEAYVYDNGGLGDSHVTSITYKDGSTTIGNLTYTYDPDGRRTSVGGASPPSLYRELLAETFSMRVMR